MADALDLFEQVLTAVIEIGDLAVWADALAALTPQLTGEDKEWALQPRLAVAGLGKIKCIVRKLWLCSPGGSRRGWEAALREGLAAAQAIDNGQNGAGPGCAGSTVDG